MEMELTVKCEEGEGHARIWQERSGQRDQRVCRLQTGGVARRGAGKGAGQEGRWDTG